MSIQQRIGVVFGAAYFIIFVVCFGPATVDSERAQREHKAECERKAQQPCAWGPSPADGLYKAMFWPFWLSYMAAK